jgi:cytochrome P450
MESMLNPPVGFPKQTFPFVDVVEEAVIMIMGGTDSTANSLQFATWRFLTVGSANNSQESQLTADRNQG